MAMIYERLLSTNIPKEKRRDSFNPRSLNRFGDDSIWMVNRREIQQTIDCFVSFFVFVLIHD